MADKKTYSFAWTRHRGLNTWDDPLDVAADQGTDAVNVHFYEGGLGTKRAGSSDRTPTGGSYFGITALGRFVPGQDDTAAEVFIVSDDNPPKILRVAAGATAVPLTLIDPIVGDPTLTVFCAFNGKLYIAYDSAVNRLHVFDPDFSTTIVRRVGIRQPDAPTGFTDVGSGAYPSTVRYYKVAMTMQRAGVTVLRSNTSDASAAATPSGTGLSLRIPMPILLGEGETHWELYGSTDGVLFYGPIATNPVGTTTWDDLSTPGDWATAYDAEPTIGANTPWPSVRYLTTSSTHLVGFGVYESQDDLAMTPKTGRVYFSPALDTSSVHDDERVSNTTTIKGWVDVARNSNGIDRGLGRLGNTVVPFQSRGIWLLQPVDSIETPFRRLIVSSALGAVSHHSIIEGEDEAGRQALYFIDPEIGPYRLGAGSLQWIGKDIKAIWDTVDQFSSERGQIHGCYYKSRHQIHWWVATPSGGGFDAGNVFVFDVMEGSVSSQAGDIRYGWSRYTGKFAQARCSAMLPENFGALMSPTLKPYIGLFPTFGTKLLRGDDPLETTDDGTPFRAFVESGGLTKEPLYDNKSLMRAHLHAVASDGAVITQTLVRGTGDDADRTAHVVLTALHGETTVLRTFEAAALTDAYAFQVRLGDTDAVAKHWTLNRWYGVVEMREPR